MFFYLIKYFYNTKKTKSLVSLITTASDIKIMLALDSELEFDLIKKDVPDFCK